MAHLYRRAVFVSVAPSVVQLLPASLARMARPQKDLRTKQRQIGFLSSD